MNDASARAQPASVVARLIAGCWLAALPAYAQTPLPAEFWNYLVEFGDAQGEVFDPSDYAAVTQISVKARAAIEREQAHSVDKAGVVPPASDAGQEYPR